VRFRARLVIPAVVGPFAVLVLSTRAVAASSVQSGWWTSAPVAVAPDVGADQLLVQGGPNASQPVAYAGISFALAPGEVPQRLAVTVAPNSATTPATALALCRLALPATSAKGDPASGGPPFDCSTKVQAAPSSTGGRYEFDVSGLGADGALNVAVLPTQSTDRVVLAKPTLDALQTTAAASTSSPSVGSPDNGGGSSAASTDVVGAGQGGTSITGTSPLSGVDTSETTAGVVSSPGPAPAPAVRASADNTTPAVRLSTPAASQRSGDSHAITPFAFGAMAAAAIAMWALAGQRSPEEASESAEISNSGELR